MPTKTKAAPEMLSKIEEDSAHFLTTHLSVAFKTEPSLIKNRWPTKDKPLPLQTFAWPNNIRFKTSEGWVPPEEMGFDQAKRLAMGLHIPSIQPTPSLHILHPVSNLLPLSKPPAVSSKNPLAFTPTRQSPLTSKFIDHSKFISSLLPFCLEIETITS